MPIITNNHNSSKAKRNLVLTITIIIEYLL